MKYKCAKSLFASRYLLILLLLLPAILSAHKLSPAAAKRFHIKKILADNNTWQLAKDIYQDKPWELSNENGVLLLSILDSFPKMNESIQGFYFVVIAKSKDKSDGFYSEGLGAGGKDYVDNHLRNFLNFFIGKGKLPDTYLEKWVDIVWLEFAITLEGTSETSKEIAHDYDSKCQQCNPSQREVLKKFEDRLKTGIDLYLSKQ
ncbi:MAG: hypothetical protein JWO03_3218 [Bacteroidetes bacterium]|nr:hypothetical protein [Bacteroidota bacterium]